MTVVANLLLTSVVIAALCGVLRELWFSVRIDLIRFLAGCRKQRLNQG